MNIFKEIGPLRAYLDNQRSIGLVPTMGALHQGHISLITRAKKENKVTVCSIYVNPAQFNNASDLEKYPRTLDKDLQMLEEAGCDVVFCPSNEEMYKGTARLHFEVGPAGEILEGEFRPGHFSGVALVVSKLFNIVKPQRAYFGLKDFQQFVIITQLVEELNFDVTLVPVPTLREPDGLAMSSRNVRLRPEERRNASQIYQSLLTMRKQLLEGMPFHEIKAMAQIFLQKHEIRLEYVALAYRQPFSILNDQRDVSNSVILLAAFVGEVRLIDNVFVP